jgi:hypothetical protein
MKTRRQSRPEPECLEDRALLSSVAHPHLAHASRVASVALNHPVTATQPLHGTVAGDYATLPSTGATGSNLSLSGAGNVGTLGNVQITATIHTSVSRATSVPMGTLLISDSQGTLQLTLKGKGGRQSLAPSPVSGNSMQFIYTIVNGTGVYRKFHGSGKVALSLTSGSTTVPPTVPPRLPPISVGDGSGSSNAGGGYPGSTGRTGKGTGKGTGTGTGKGSGTNTPPPATLPPSPAPPAPVPPTTLPPTTAPPTGTNAPPSTLPPVGLPGHGSQGTGGPGKAGIRAHGVKTFAVKAVPLAPTFLKGHFTLVFNGSPSIGPSAL